MVPRPKAKAPSRGSSFPGGSQAPIAPQQPPMRPGDPCFYKSATHGWIPAVLKQYHANTDRYDLDAKQQVPPESVFSLQPGAAVEYHSTSTNDWIPASVVRMPNAGSYEFDLDVKNTVHISRIRPPPSAKGLSPMNPGLAGSSLGTVPALRRTVDAKDAVVMRQRLESSANLNRPPQTRDPVSLALAELQRAIRSRDLHTLSAAIERAATAGVKQEDLEDAATALRDLEEPMWRFDPEDNCHLDIRQQPSVDGPRHREALLAGEVFRVSQEQRGSDGINYLKLADGRGWVFEKKDGVGTLCYRYEVVRYTVIVSANHPLGVGFSEIPVNRIAVRSVEPGGWAEQQGILPGDEVLAVAALRVGSSVGLGELIKVAQGKGPRPLALTLACREDSPGSYVVVHDGAAVTRTVAIGTDSDVVGTLRAGTTAEVRSVVNNTGEQRIRGKISQPYDGWVSLLNTESGKRWARKKQA
eukprot:TRINITY_DN58819_c0_g1_i1.p1 TRINITY_DN58819_c0_g1~~TRINITY_DN58819_c0_g1_i1.p1  ORF type:complete len:516 (-),score=85.97 TRINITY_DN58819_c0_g1_i1:450-1859(-)